MSDYLLHCAASNWLMSSVLAAFAWFAQSKLRRPVIAHLLWLLVLVKLVTPPLFSLAVIPAPVAPAATLATNVLANHTGAASTALASEPVAAATLDATSVLLSLWLLGSVIVLIWSTFRIVRFHRLLTLASRPAPQDLMQRAAQLAKTLGLKKTPSINITSARVTPMVWWVGGKVRVFIPEAMPAELGSNQMRWILAHELGHVRRGDHFVRWLEWLACVAFWWNPIAWLARRNLRANEEVCCDALVLRSLKGKPHSYANSLLAAVEFLASPGLRPPAMASEINSGGFLERRFRMIVSKTPIATTPRWLQAVLLVCTVAVMPLGIAYAQNPDVGAVTKRLRKAVQA
ncbi:MAG: bla regulator protein BlaR1, partial [Hyphomicrobiaceae bacterium]